MSRIEKNTYSPKQIATYNRQKCINLLEKIMKNLYRSFRDKTMTKNNICERFIVLKKRLDMLGDVYVDAEYHREMQKYIGYIGPILLSDIDIDSIRDEQMQKLNRIQKIKNGTNYKRTRHNNINDGGFAM